MSQDSSGTYVAAADLDRVTDDLEDLGRYIIDRFQSMEQGEITAQEAISASAVYARFKGLHGSVQE